MTKQIHYTGYVRLAALFLAAALLLVTGAGCATGAGASTGEGEDEVTKILIGNSAGPKPYSYYDEDNNLTGYEIELLREIDALLPQYEFEIEVTEFASILTGMDSGRYQLGTNNFTWKQEREDKYLFSEEYFVYNYTVAVVAQGREDIVTLDDLGGKRTYLSSNGGFAQLFIEDYNEANPDNQILATYSGADSIKVLTDIEDGVIDFTFMETVMYNNYLETYPSLQLSYVTFSREETSQIQDPYAWFLYPKEESSYELRDAVDEAIRTLAENGRMQELSEEFFGFDMTGR